MLKTYNIQECLKKRLLELTDKTELMAEEIELDW